MKLKNLLGIIISFIILWGCKESPENHQQESAIFLEPKTDSIQVGNTTFEYRIDEGKGETPCIVVGLAHMYPETFSNDLKSKFKFIHSDYRGVIQKNDSIDISLITLDTLLNDIEVLRKKLELGKIAIFGHSVHGLVALEYSRKYPENTTHVIMVGSPARTDTTFTRMSNEYWESHASNERKQILIDRQESMKDSINKESREEGFVLSYITNAPIYWYDPNYDCTWIWKGLKPLNFNFVSHIYGTIFKDYTLDWTQKKVESPVFVALGKYDFAAPPTVWDETSKNSLSNVTTELFDESGHWPFFEEQELFDEKLTAWMESME